MNLTQAEEAAKNQFEILELASCSEKMSQPRIQLGELTIRVAPEDLIIVLEELKRNRHFEYQCLMDVTAVDNPAQSQRFMVVYHLLSMTQNHRIRIEVPCAEGQDIPSACELYQSANWYEREVFDMFGIGFIGHPDMRRILTDYGFEGHPLRKDFPTSGYVQLRYDELEKRCVYEPVELVQDYRSFDFMSPWESAKYVLPGDEKAGDEKSG